MQKGGSKYLIFFLSATLLVVGIMILYPFCKYYIDPDATAYLTIAKRYAAGDWQKAVNGYWSPWSCWLIALLLKLNILITPASVIINAIAALGFLYISYSFFLLFDVSKRLRLFLSSAMVFFLCYAVFKQLFADLWECFFLLSSLRIMLSKNYKNRVGLWVMNGLLGALAYFSKAYAFPFFILNTLCCTFIFTEAHQKQNRLQWLKASIVPILVMIACSMPWIYLLHDKYGIWMTSTAGRLNTSWYLVGHPEFRSDIKHLLPPVYDDSPYYWEDPFIVNGATLHFWSSPRLFLLQIVKLVYNALKFVRATGEISSFYIVVWLVAVCLFLSKSFRQERDKKYLAVVCSFLLFPLGFLLINYEARYIWYTLPLSILIGAWIIQYIIRTFPAYKHIGVIVPLVFVASYLVTPIWEMRELTQGKTESQYAEVLKQNGIKGSFASNVNAAPSVRSLISLAYRSGCPYYNMPFKASHSELLSEMRRYKVKYYFYYNADKGAVADDFIFKDENDQPFPQINKNEDFGVKIFLVNP